MGSSPGQGAGGFFNVERIFFKKTNDSPEGVVTRTMQKEILEVKAKWRWTEGQFWWF
jgi:hypothetical protein